VREGDEVTNDDAPMSERFQRFLDAVEPDRGATVISYRPISGGYSRVTAVSEVRWGDGAEERFVLRADPQVGTGVFSSERDPEWDLLQALSEVDTVVIPKPRWYDATGEFFGAKCIVMEHCEGVPLQSTLAEDKDPSEATEVYLEVAAAIQRTPLDALPTDMERPADWDTYLDSAIEIYERAERDIPDCSPVVRYVTAWLRAHRPPPVPLGLVHGDFQPGNILVAPDRPPVVIDWEFTRIGDPREDIGYYSSNPLPRNLYGVDPQRFLSTYRELTGLSETQVNSEVIDYFFMLGMASLFAQMMDGAAAIAEGRRSGLMNVFLINSLSYFHGKYLSICAPVGATS
jgi:aminoglycoside phosphotransferase (APT) family kinase protein